MKVRDYRTGGGYLRGIDVSSHQGTINFAKVKASGIKFVILRAYGSAHSSGGDSKFREYYNGFKSVGIPCGSYMYVMIPKNGDLSTARHQANLYADKLEAVHGKGKWGELLPFMDLEGNSVVNGTHDTMNNSLMIAWVKEYRKTFEARFNNKVKLGLYTSWYFIKDHFPNGELSDMPLWMAKWRTNSIPDVGGFTNWVAWQYTDNAIPFSNGKEVGVSSIGLDMNYAESLEDLMMLETQVEEKIIPTMPTPTATYREDNSILISFKKIPITPRKVELFRNGEAIVVWHWANYEVFNWVDKNLEFDSDYIYHIKVTKSDGEYESAKSNIVKTMVAPPSAPTGLEVETLDRAVRMTWNKNPVDEKVKAYDVLINGNFIDQVTDTTFVYNNLFTNLYYEFQVRAVNDNPTKSELSESVMGATTIIYPNIATNLRTTIKSKTSVLLEWDYVPKDDFSHFEIIIDNTVRYTTDKKQYLLNNLISNKNIEIKIRAYDYDNDSLQSEKHIFQIFEPQKIETLSATPRDRQIVLNWSTYVNNPNVKSFIIWQGNKMISIVDNTVDTLTIENLENAKEYAFYIQAESIDEIEGALSDPIFVSPIQDFPNKATNLQAIVENENTIFFNWEHELSENFSHFDVLVNDNLVLPNTQLKKYRYIGAFPNKDYKLEIISYDIQNDSVTSGVIQTRINIPSVPQNVKIFPKDREALLTWDLNPEAFVKGYNVFLNEELYAYVDSPSNSIMVTGLINEVDYSFQVQAIGENNFTSDKTYHIYGRTKLNEPKQPRIIMHKELGGNAIELIWEHETKEYHSHYNVYKNGFMIARNVKEKRFITNYLESNKTHSFQVEAFDTQGDRSGFSNSYFITLYAKIIEPLSVFIGKIDEQVDVIKPSLYLCKPNKQTIAKLNEARNINFTNRYSDLNELSFDVSANVENNFELEFNSNLNKLKERYLIRLEYGKTIEYFIINEITQNSEQETKNLHCWSLGYELKDKLINNFTQEIYTAKSAMQIALDSVLNWSIGANIKNEDFYWNQETRIFDVANMTVLDFIISIATSFNAILVWDSVNRVIDFQNPTIQDENRGLKIKYGKYLKSLSETSTTEQMVTSLRPIGENKLSIREVTVNGSDVLEDFSFFLNGFEMESDEFANYYFNSKTIAEDENDEYYKNLGLLTVPKGAVFSKITKNGNVSNSINSEDIANALINMIRLFETTKSRLYLDKARLFGDFLVNNKIIAITSNQSYSIVPNKYYYDAIANEWKVSKTQLPTKTIYSTVLALIKLHKYDSKSEYKELIDSSIFLLAYLFNDVQTRITLEEIEIGFEGLIYSHLNYVTINEFNEMEYQLELTTFSNENLGVFSEMWNEYITQFGNPPIVDIVGNIITPQEIRDTTKLFFETEFNSARILMPTSQLPYSYYNYNPNIDFIENLNAPNGKTFIPIPKNYDSDSEVYSNISWFNIENVINIAIGYYELDLEIIAKTLRNKIFDIKSASDFINNRIVFFVRYNLNGTGGVNFDTSKSLSATGLFMELEHLLKIYDNLDLLKEQLLSAQIKHVNPNLNNAFYSIVDDINSDISTKTLNSIILPLSYESQIKVIGHSPYMSDELCKAIINYNKLLEVNEGIFQSLMQEKRDKNLELIELKYDQTIKETDLFIIQDLLDSLKANNELWYEYVTYSDISKKVKWEIKKDYKYALFGKAKNINDINVQTSKENKQFTSNDEWMLLEKISFDRTNEGTVESTIDDYLYEITLTGTGVSDLEFQVNRILNTEFDAVDNESELIDTYIEEIKQIIYDEQTELVKEKETEIEILNNDMETIQNKLSIYNNFTSQEREERDLFVITKEYIDEKIANPEELKNNAIEKFEEIKNPVITIQISIVNLLEVLEEHHNWNKLEIGTIINIFYEKLNISLEAKIIEMAFSFDSQTINLTISNVKDIRTNQEKFINALYGAISTSTTVSIEKHNWSKAIELKEDFDSFVNKEFDATKQKIIAGTNETVEISRRGLLIKNALNPFAYLVANASVLAITNDGGRSYKNAITTDGIIGERIVGKILAGENLIIENANGTFKVDGNGVTISNQALNIVGGITQEQISSDVTLKSDLSGIVGNYVDTLEQNKTIDVIPYSPTFNTGVGAIAQYTDVTNDLADISFDWEFNDDNSDASNIDGFMIYIYTSTSSAPYVFGNNPQAEISFHVKYDKRSIILTNVPKNLYYNVGIEAYRVVTTDINPSGVLKSPLIQTTPFKPSLFTAYQGNIIGTINYGKEVRVRAEILSAIRLGMSYDNVTIDSNNGLQATSNDNTQKTILNSLGFRIQTNDGTGFVDKLYATPNGLVAEDLIANRLIVNDGTGKVLINAHTRQINFDNFDVIAGQIYAQNVNLKGLEVLNETGTKTLGIDINGNITLTGNITMLGGSILWETLESTLVENTEKTGFWLDAGKLQINASHIKGGEIDGTLIKANTLHGDSILAGTLNGDTIIAGSLSFSQSQGGILTLGGSPLGEVNGIQVYENGIFSVVSGTGEEIARLDGDYGGFGKLRIDEVLDTKNVVFRTHIDSANIDTTTGSIVYYVDPVFGNDDTTTTGTATDPFMKVQTAIDRLPIYLDRNVTIYFKPTLLADTNIYIEGFVGKGTIELLVWHTPVRFIRDWTFGSNKNTSNHWSEILAERTGGGIAYGNTVTYPNNVLTNSKNTLDIEKVSNNNANDGFYDAGSLDINNQQVPLYVDVYLNYLATDLTRIKIWHYFADSRIYQGTKTEVSEDRVTWYPLFDSEREGIYTETAQGHYVYVNKAKLNGFIKVFHSTIPVIIKDLIVNAKGTNEPTIHGHNNTYLLVDQCILFGDINFNYTVYSHAGNIRVINSEVYDSALGGVMSAYGGRTEITNSKGSGFKYGHMAHSSGVTGGGGTGLVGTTANIFEMNGGVVTGTWTHSLGEFSEGNTGTETNATGVARTKTWTSVSSKSYDTTQKYWADTSDVRNGKWGIYGVFKGLWFFPTDLRTTCMNANSIEKVRVYITRTNSAGNTGATTFTLRTHGYASKPTGEPTIQSTIQTFSLNRGEGKWIDITTNFKTLFKNGTAWGIGLYTTNTSSAYYGRCTGTAKIEITYTENK